MYCGNCGTKLQEGQRYCSNCGTKADEVKNEMLYRGGGLQTEAPSAQKEHDSLGSNKKVYYGCILCLLVSIFVINQEMFEISYTVIYENSISWTLFEEYKTVGTLFVIAYIAAAGLMLWPLMGTNMKWEKRYFTLAKCVPMVALGWIALMIVKAAAEVTDLMHASDNYVDALLFDMADMSATLTINAWLFLALSFGAIILAYKACNSLVPKTQNEE